MITKPIEIFCLAFFLFMNFCHNQVRRHDENSLYTWRAQIVLSFIATVDLIIAMNTQLYPWVAAFTRPLMIVLLYRVLRQQVRRYLYTVATSAPMFFVVIIYVLYFSWMLQRYFAGTLEGFKYFPDFWNSFWNMLVLISTANYPDIMLPAY